MLLFIVWQALIVYKILCKDAKRRHDSSLKSLQSLQRVTQTPPAHVGSLRKVPVNSSWGISFVLFMEWISGDTEFARVHRMIDHVETWICNLTRSDETYVRAEMQRSLKGGEKQRIFSVLDGIH